MDKNKLIEEIDRAGNKTVKDAARHAIPARNSIVGIIKDIQSVLFPNYFVSKNAELLPDRNALLEKIEEELRSEIEKTAHFRGDTVDVEKVTEVFISKLPYVKEMLCRDAEALYEGDPAAKSREEVLICYPGFYAISIYRLAHELYELKVPLIPRIMTEYAHEKTGIDIHAGAKIGEYFFIDHGTGIVIGETTVIGDHVKLYQGVTLGAKSFELDANGNPVKDIKRHPNIGNNVVIYANATILGGSTYIGDGCTIGGSVWLTHSVEPGKTVYYEP